MKFKLCDGEVLKVSYDGGKTWKYVTKCCESFDEIFESIASALKVYDYELIYENNVN